MDKIREEFGEWYNQGDYTFNDGAEIYEEEWEEAQRGAYIAGGKPRDEELEDRKLECIDYQETIIKQQAEIKKLRESLTHPDYRPEE